MIRQNKLKPFDEDHEQPISQRTNMIRKEFGFLERLNDPSHVYVICGDCLILQYMKVQAIGERPIKAMHSILMKDGRLRCNLIHFIAGLVFQKFIL